MRTTHTVAEGQDVNLTLIVDWDIAFERGDPSVGDEARVLLTPKMLFPVTLEAGGLRIPLTEEQVLLLASTEIMNDMHEFAVEDAYALAAA